MLKLYYLKNGKKAFTLVELSIVIVVVALIIAGVAAGSSLVQQFKLRSVLSNKDMYFSAMRAFEIQYGSMAGDITNAQSYWGTTDSFSNPVKNGDGDKVFYGPTEGLYAWQHLRLASLLNNGRYAGRITSYANIVPGINIGLSGYSKLVGFHWITFGEGNGWGYGSLAVYGRRGVNVLGLGKVRNTGSPYINSGAVLTANQASSLDGKIDDGLPARGMLLADNGSETGVGSCSNGASTEVGITAATAATLTYVSSDVVGCRLMFIYK